jgi:hypothetical protein
MQAAYTHCFFGCLDALFCLTACILCLLTSIHNPLSDCGDRINVSRAAGAVFFILGLKLQRSLPANEG